MRKLKLQVQISVNGYVAGPGNELDWITWKQSKDMVDYVNALTDSVDTILLGRKMTREFIEHFNAKLKNPVGQKDEFAEKMMGYRKVVFTRTLQQSEWENTVLATGDITQEVNKLKAQSGKDIIVYGGAGFVSSLIKAGLIDEFHLLVNPVVLPDGLPVFNLLSFVTQLKLNNTQAFGCGIVLLNYSPA